MPATVMTLLFLLLFLAIAILSILAPFLGLGFMIWKRHRFLGSARLNEHDFLKEEWVSSIFPSEYSGIVAWALHQTASLKHSDSLSFGSEKPLLQHDRLDRWLRWCRRKRLRLNSRWRYAQMAGGR